LKACTASARRVNLDAICQSIHPESRKPRGDMPSAGMKRANVIALRDSITTGPCACNATIGALRIVYNWAIENDFTTYNPAIRIERMPWNRDGHHVWTEHEYTQFEKRHPIGSTARLAFTLIAYTGVRRSDAIRLGPQMERAGVLHFTEYKGSDSKALGKFQSEPKVRAVQISPELRAMIDATPSGHLIYLLNKRGRPFASSTFDHQFHDWCIEAGLPHCSAHGIRKAAATTIADNGGTAHQLRAFGGWSTLKQVEGYTRKANNAKLGAQAVDILSAVSQAKTK
jgi:integrase